MPFDVDLAAPRFACRGITLGGIEPLIDGDVVSYSPPEISASVIQWKLECGIAVLEVETGDVPVLHFRLEGIPPDREIDSLGLRFATVDGVRRYLRNGYQSWDGSFFVEPGTAPGDGPPAKAPTLGFAMTALLPKTDDGAVVLGFTRHDRFQSRFRFGGSASASTLQRRDFVGPDATPGRRSRRAAGPARSERS